ncbi:hypothetical protein [Paenibacillus sp. NPDC058071]|uniref:hypothetical protein n=1 Tax=Paenibacillus sp. NPDC058071 TaxID=3346326 RepID=UPI0036DC96D8
MMLLRIYSQLGTLASLIGVIFLLPKKSGEGTSVWIIIFSVVAVIAFIISIFLEIKLHQKLTGKKVGGTRNIRDYMYDWISKPGVAFIFTRDLSWVNDDEMKEMLRRKANNNELHICMADRNSIASELENSGAKIYTYSSLNYTLKSRFTFMNIDRADCRVAIGKEINGVRYVEELTSSNAPHYWVLNDLMEILRRVVISEKEINHQNEQIPVGSAQR